MNIRTAYKLGALFLCPLLSAQTNSKSPPPNPQSLIIKDFEDRVAAYVKLRNQIKGELPAQKQTNSPSKITEYKSDIAPKLRAARASAHQGDIFTPEISRAFRRILAAPMTGSDGNRVRASLRRAEPVEEIALKVNAAYPENEPLQSTPPTLLLDLPKLPRELEYRLVGRNLILLDVTANMIVDFLVDALPPS